MVLFFVILLLLIAALLLWLLPGRSGPASVPANLKSNLVFYFNFDSPPTDGKIPDLSGQGNNGEAVNVLWIADGHRGGAISLSPNDSHIRVPNNDSLNPPEFTACAWIKTSRADHYWRRIFDKGLFHNGFDLTMAGDWTKWKPPSKFRGTVEFETLKTPETASKRSLADGQWHQIVATYDENDKRLFVDGQLESKRHRPNVTLRNDFDLVIGGFTDPDPTNDDPHASFNGSLDDVMMFNRALSADEVQTLYNTQKTADDQ
jgi:arabinan endo-1,5-alpha-L-arabinosidase